jgi:hypothetical protein
LEINSIVIVSLTAPKEKIWGQLLMLSPAGVTTRGIAVEAFDDFLRQVLSQEETAGELATVFYPMHRVGCIALDQPSGSLPSLSDRFRNKVGFSIQEYLGSGTPQV